MMIWAAEWWQELNRLVGERCRGDGVNCLSGGEVVKLAGRPARRGHRPGFLAEFCNVQYHWQP